MVKYHVFGALAQLGARNTGSVEVRGSNPLCSTTPVSFRYGPFRLFRVVFDAERAGRGVPVCFGLVAQLGERCVRNAEVMGSNPTRSTILRCLGIGEFRRRSSVGQSVRFTSVRSRVRAPSSPPKKERQIDTTVSTCFFICPTDCFPYVPALYRPAAPARCVPFSRCFSAEIGYGAAHFLRRAAVLHEK